MNPIRIQIGPNPGFGIKFNVGTICGSTRTTTLVGWYRRFSQANTVTGIVEMKRSYRLKNILYP